MKAVLINPPWYHIAAEPIRSMNLGLSYLVSYLRNKGHQVEAIDSLFDGHQNIAPVEFKYQNVFRIGLAYADIVDRIPADADLIGISAPFSNHARIIKELSAQIKRKFPHKPIVIGGSYPSTSPEDIVSMDVDYAVRGEGEVPLEKLLSGQNPSRISGVCYKSNGGFVDNGVSEIIHDLDRIPFPARDVFHYQEILDSTAGSRIRVGTEIVNRESRGVPIVTSRGCPYDCKFCSIHFVNGHKWRFRSAENVIDEITYLVKNYQINEFAILDDHLTGKRDRLIKILDRLIELDLGVKWATPNGVRVDYLDAEIMLKMKKAGCVSLVLGIQHGDPKMLELMGTKLDLSKVEEVVKIGSKLGLEMAAFFIIGYPGEGRKSFRKLIKYGQRLGRYGLKDFRINIARAYPKTELFNYCLENDLFVKKDVANIFVFPGDELEANIQTKDFGPKELIWRREYAKRKLMAVENPFYWNLVYYFERWGLKKLLKQLIPQQGWNRTKHALYKLASLRLPALNKTFGQIYKYHENLTLWGRMGYYVYGYPFLGGYLRSLYFRRLLKNVYFQNCLDAGCGAGEYSFYLARLRPEVKIEAVDKDIDRDYFQRLQKIMSLDNITFIKKDIQEVNAVEKYDFIYSIDVLEHIKNNQEVIKRLYLALKPGGKIIVHIPLKSWDKHGVFDPKLFTRYNEFVKHEHPGQVYEAQDFKELLTGIGFKIKKLKLTFGCLGKFAWEIDQYFIEKRHFLIRAGSLPFLKALCLLDVHLKHKQGAGVIVLAERSEK